MDDARSRTVRAALLALVIGLLSIGGLGMFLGLPTAVAWGAGVAFGVLMCVLILAAARRADSFEGPAPPDPRSPHGRPPGSRRTAGDDGSTP